jgi:hypothetical protein
MFDDPSPYQWQSSSILLFRSYYSQEGSTIGLTQHMTTIIAQSFMANEKPSDQINAEDKRNAVGLPCTKSAFDQP